MIEHVFKIDFEYIERSSMRLIVRGADSYEQAQQEADKYAASHTASDFPYTQEDDKYARHWAGSADADDIETDIVQVGVPGSECFPDYEGEA